jgi:hypothetical protein
LEDFYYGMNLHPNRIPYDNDNPIVFGTVCLLLSEHLDEVTDDQREAIKRLIEKTRYAPGRFVRTPDRIVIDRKNSHDNYLALAIASEYLGLNYGLELFIEGAKTGYTYDNLHMQPKDQALIALLSGYKPTIFQGVYLALSFVFNAFQGTNRGSEHQMQWLRREALALAPWNDTYHKILSPFVAIWSIALDIKGGFSKICSLYYREPNHPNRLLSKRIDKLLSTPRAG